jgi:glycosyltransferase involved in cell wall biosynthesis
MSNDQQGNTPLFSIITVTYNAEKELPRTLKSVREQTFDSYEHLIIDGASKDATVEIARKDAPAYQRLESSPDHGLYDAMNKGLAMAQGDYVLFLNAGDAFHSPHTLEHVAGKILDNDFPGVVYGQTDLVDADGKRLAARHLEAPVELNYDSFKDGMVVCHQAFYALRRIAGEFDLRYRFSADYEWCIRVLQHSRHTCYLDEVVADYLMEGMTTRNRRKSLIERFKIMCYYYGTLPTILRHFKFLLRFRRRQKLEKSLLED